MTNPNSAAQAVQEAERNAAAESYFDARPSLDTVNGRRIYEAGFDRAYALLSKLRAPVADERAAFEALFHRFDLRPSIRVGHYADLRVQFMWEAWKARADRAIMASAPVAGEAHGWSGWACQYPNKLPRLYGAKEIAQLNCDVTNGDRVLFLSEHAAPQASAEDVRNAALEEAATVAENSYADAHIRIRALKQPQADKESPWCCERGEARGVKVCQECAEISAGYQASMRGDKDGGQQRAGDAERWRWATATDENAQMLYTIVQAYGGDQKKINERADFYRAALSAAQTEQGERDA